MSVLDNFIAFARALPTARRAQIEESLAALMDSFGEQFDFTAEEMAELRRRAEESEPALSKTADIARIFGKPFRN